MKSSIRFACLAAILAGLTQLPVGVATSQVAEEGSDMPPPPPPLPEITYYDGADWKPLGRHGISVEGAGATPAGAATATFKAKLDGPKTYVVLDGATSEVLLSGPRPRFRIESDRTGAFRVQLAQFETRDDSRRTTIERVRSGAFYTKGVDLEVMEIAEGLWELRPTKSLQPGEYALAVSDTEPAADFTIVDKGY
ncbi:MAG TPA: hypothetical protein VER38_06275 [Candidatus Eisenbacteria bacterium]|nr:hypothetical protein [Candidatus Eisenbacteria bacterium]